jgi:transposase
MITLPAAVRIYLYTAPCDMRRGFDGLKTLAEVVIGVDPLAGHLFVFCSRRADRLKILYWDRDGWALWSKRLEAGTYAFPFAATGRREITSGELGALLEGLDLGNAKRRKRYLPPLQQAS